MGYIKQKNMWQFGKIMRFKSRKRKTNHMTIVCYAADEETRQVIKEEIKKAIHKMNRLLETEVSYDGVIILEKVDLEIKMMCREGEIYEN